MRAEGKPELTNEIQPGAIFNVNCQNIWDGVWDTRSLFAHAYWIHSNDGTKPILYQEKILTMSILERN